MPGDGYVDPELLALALADGARRQGVAVHTGVAVTGIDVDDGRVTGVQTSRGPIAAEVVVIAAGAATGVVGAMAGAVIPITPMRHQYVVTEPLAEDVEGITTVRDPDHIMYFRPHDSGGLLVGGYSREPVTWDTDAPLAEPRTTFEPDMERFAESWEGARNRVPALRDLDVGQGGQRARGLHPRRRLHPGRDRGRRPVDRRRVLRARPGRRRRRGQGHGRVDHRRPARVRHGVDGHPPLRRALRVGLLRARARAERLLALLRHRLPAPGVRRRAPAAPLPRLPAAGRAGRRVRREGRAGSA